MVSKVEIWLVIILFSCSLFVISTHSWAVTSATEEANNNNDADDDDGGDDHDNSLGLDRDGDEGLPRPSPAVDGTSLSRPKRSKSATKIICYACLHHSLNPNPDCLDPMWEHDIKAVACQGTCVKTKWTESDGSVKLSRACWKARCVENSTETMVRTCCHTNHCNSAESNRLPWLRVLAVAAVAAAIATKLQPAS